MNAEKMEVLSLRNRLQRRYAHPRRGAIDIVILELHRTLMSLVSSSLMKSRMCF